MNTVVQFHLKHFTVGALSIVSQLKIKYVLYSLSLCFVAIELLNRQTG